MPMCAFRCSTSESVVQRESGSAVETVAVIGSVLRGTKRKGPRSEMKGGACDMLQITGFKQTFLFTLSCNDI